jgi:aldose 1-epimerase
VSGSAARPGERAAAVGDVVTIGDGRLTLEVLPDVGARIHRLRLDGHDLLRTPADPARHLDDPWFWGSYPMAPWCNRLPPVPTPVAGRVVDLPANFRDGTAIHGQVDQAPWQRTADASFRIEGGGAGWPWPYAVEQQFAIDGVRLDLLLRLTNLADEPMPAGIGIHPWFAKPVAVAIQASAVHPDNLATEAEPVPVAGDLDRRRLGPMPDDLDGTWVDLGEPPIRLAWPGPGIDCAITFEALTRVVTAASPASVDAIAVEPATHAPAGIRRLLNGEPGAMSLLGPGTSIELHVRFAFGTQT